MGAASRTGREHLRGSIPLPNPPEPYGCLLPALPARSGGRRRWLGYDGDVGIDGNTEDDQEQDGKGDADGEYELTFQADLKPASPCTVSPCRGFFLSPLSYFCCGGWSGLSGSFHRTPFERGLSGIS